MNVQHYSEIPRGGHFGTMEELEYLANDIRGYTRGILQAAVQ
jgi:hypothetical protein